MRLLWLDTTPHARIDKQRIRTLRQLDPGIKQLTAEIEELVNQTGTRLRDIHGIGVLVPATILAEVAATPTGTPPKTKSPWPTVTHPWKPVPGGW